MDCRRMENLISPYLDRELSPSEMEAVLSHLSVCARCEVEYKSMRRIQEACNNMGKIPLKAPAGFKDAVMQKIASENVQVLRQKPSVQNIPGWRKAAVGVAAAAMLALGALSMNPVVVQIADNTPVIDQPAGDLPGAVDPGNSPAAADPGRENPSAAGGNYQNPTVALNPANNGAPSAVFLNKERYVVTTLLRIEVADAAEALEHALKIASQAPAQTVNLGQQVDANGSYTAVKITVNKTTGPDLIMKLSSLGTVSGQEVDKNDITARYADTLSRYQALVTQRATLTDDSQKSLMDERITDLAAELQDWEAQAEQETIVLWLK